MKRKKSSEGGANWMDTYGDMVTLLLCFFVLLYSMSSISEENWKAIVMSFNPNAQETLTETSGNDGPNADPNTEDGSGAGMLPTVDQDAEGITQEDIDADIEALFMALQEYVSSQGAEGTISVTKGDGKVFVTFNDVIFFDAEEPTLREEAKPILEAVGGMLTNVKDSIDEVRMIGHTAQADPDHPNNPAVDRNLSAQRAANAIAHIQINTELDPARMISEGYGQWRPVASNDTPEGRAKNRRVEMIISGRDIEAELAEELDSYQTDIVVTEPDTDSIDSE